MTAIVNRFKNFVRAAYDEFVDGIPERMPGNTPSVWMTRKSTRI